MGLLDDAIREHLELKRRGGADAGEVSRLESEALGPVRRSPDGTPDLSSIPGPPLSAAAPPSDTLLTGPRDEDPPGFDDEPDWGDETVVHTPPPSPAQSPPPSAPTYTAPPSGYVTAPALPDPSFDDAEPLAPLDEPDLAPPPQKSRRLPGAGRLRLRRGQRASPTPNPSRTATTIHRPPHTSAHTSRRPRGTPRRRPPNMSPRPPRRPQARTCSRRRPSSSRRRRTTTACGSSSARRATSTSTSKPARGCATRSRGSTCSRRRR